MLWALAILREQCVLEEKLVCDLNSRWAQAFMSLPPGSDGQYQHMANVVWAFAQLRLDPLDGR